MKTRGNSGFTLIEMLAVIVVIMILAGMLYPALRAVREGPKKAEARADITRLELALHAYYAEYGAWPPTPASAAEFTAMLNGNRYPYNGGTGPAYATGNNTRGIKFMDFDMKQINSSNEFLDPWGNAYMICLDNGGAAFGNTWIGGWWGDNDGGPPGGTWKPANDGLIRYRPTTTYGFQKEVAIYSMGPNESDDLAQGAAYDDITNWY